MDSGHGNSYDTLYFDNHATVTCTFHLQKHTLLPLKFTAGIRTWCLWTSSIHPVENKEDDHRKCGYGNETLHLTVGDNNLLPLRVSVIYCR